MITRFAPSPTGPLHLGHAYSALLAHDMAMVASGTFLLRIEDIDQSRSRPEWAAQIYDDLTWLGLSWPEPVMRQSERANEYKAALERLWSLDLLYPCTCSRRDVQDALGAPQEGAPLHGPDGLIYPGTCRDRSKQAAMPDAVLRLDMSKAARKISFIEEVGIAKKHTFLPETLITSIGDVVLARRDMGTSYHLSVVVDDAEQQVSHVVRGKDLAPATPIHVLLQSLLGLPTPVYHHHKLIRDEAGKRLAKRDDARAITKYRDAGVTPEGIRELLNLPPR
ncbi:glutamyl-Q tRNA(Asp) synthetase [Cognatiyoonia koreensis]|uniref:Glutamyl-Q tRNA(Asp) synthetase n=1 Tax=Cognatiyoonia koreensis TaxID=364200 RepID=A0A1I0P957_9RHOB|nr:tRNA glutamyl-Q(34) synthetase GluQRS [Cognatiyoonia koreensis]SEW10642.1 glutamyl-Q tRNA(Asp) synthetase [Cognatiyoonia koreensis]